MDPNADINSVQYMFANANNLTMDQKIVIKRKGRPTPDLRITHETLCKNRTYRRTFSKKIYDKYDWMCGCTTTNKLFCFVCLLFRRGETMWSEHGVNDLHHLAGRAKKHEHTVVHTKAYIDFRVLGDVEVCNKQLNKLVCKEEDKNCDILRRLIMCIKFCGAFELDLGEQNPSAYEGLINFAADLDSMLAFHMKGSDIYGARNDLLEAMLKVYRSEIIEEVLAANFIAFQVDNVISHQQKALSIRYLFNGEIFERFWAFLSDGSAEAISKELEVILNDPKNNVKVIAQSYDGPSAQSIKKMYPNAHIVQSYAHDANSFLETIVQSYKQVRIFYAGLQAFRRFFSRSSETLAILDGIAKTKPSWNLKIRTAITIHQHEAAINQCLEMIIDNDAVDSRTLSEASGLLNDLKCQEFRYWLNFFNLIMPHVEMLFNRARKPGMESWHLTYALNEFQKQITRVRCAVDNTDEELDRRATAKTFCDHILTQMKLRFEFKEHLCAATLLQSKSFLNYRQGFPDKRLETVMKSYPMLDSAKLRNELAAIYERDDMGAIAGIRPLLLFIAENNLTKILSETDKLIQIICTTPMPTNESERRFMTLNRIKTFLNRTVSEERLNALAVLSIEKKFIQSILDFDKKVIDVFDCKENGCSLKKSTPATPKPKKNEPSDRPDLVNIQMLRDANEEEEEETEVEESEIKIEMDEMDVEEAALLSINKEESDREMNGAATHSTNSHVEEPDQESSAAARHPLQIFFDSMACTAMSFPPPLAVRAKTGVLEVISKLELEMWNQSE